VPQELDLSPKVLTLIFVLTVALMLTPDLGMIGAKLEHDVIIVTPSFCFEGMTLLDKNGEPQELDLSPIVLTLVFVATIVLLLTPDLGMIEATLEIDSLIITPFILF